MRKNISLLIIGLFLFSVGFVSAQGAEDPVIEKLDLLNIFISEIKTLPWKIDDDICAKDWAAYRTDMNLLAQAIINANLAVEDVKLYYPVDLWYIYNTIANDPICGISKKAMDGFYVAETSVRTNEEMLGMYENSDICMCWNIATGREEPTGFYKDGACRCNFGNNAFSPQTGRNDVPWHTDPDEGEK